MEGQIADLLQHLWHLTDTCSGIFPACGCLCVRETRPEGCMSVGRGACLEVEMAVCCVYTCWGVHLVSVCVLGVTGFLSILPGPLET